MKNKLTWRLSIIGTIVCLSGMAFAEGGVAGTPNDGCWTVKNADGTVIGTIAFENNGNRGDFTNDPATNPNGLSTALLYDSGDDDYNFPAGGSVSFSDPGTRGGDKDYTKKDAAGNTTETGSISKGCE